MLFVTAERKGFSPLVYIGMTESDVTKMKDGSVIRLDGKTILSSICEVPPGGKILIFYAREKNGELQTTLKKEERRKIEQGLYSTLCFTEDGLERMRGGGIECDFGPLKIVAFVVEHDHQLVPRFEEITGLKSTFNEIEMHGYNPTTTPTNLN